MHEQSRLRKTLSVIVLLIFLFQIGYLIYHLPSLLFLGLPITDDVKLSAVIAGLCLGILLILKGYTNPLE